VGLALGSLAVAPAMGSSYAPGQILVKYTPATPSLARAASTHGAVDETEAPVGHTRLLHLARGVSVPATLRALRARHDVLWAVPDYRAHTAGEFIPNDPGLGGSPTDWEQLQWNFMGEFGVNAPEAWANVAADGAPGGRGVIVAVLDTGVAYANRGRFRRSPDFGR
jgi:serine protease